MPLSPKTLLKPLAKYIPEERKPAARRAYGYLELRSRAVTTRRRVVSCSRVEFLDLEIAYLEKYEFLTPDVREVLVDTRCTIVSPGTERAVLCGLPGVPRGMFPFPPGYSAVGTIRELGPGMKQYAVGQRVAGRLSHASCGIMSPVSLFPVPDEVSDEQGAFIELGIITLQGIRRAHITPGARVAVVGQGMLGQLSNRLARVCGAASVVAVASSRNRAAGALRDGWADSYIALNDKPVLSDIQADVVIEAVGTPGAVLTAMSCARDGGKVILLGSSRGIGRNIDVYNAAQARQITLVGAHISALPSQDVSPGRFTYNEEGRLFLDLLRRGRLKVDDLITWRAQPQECNAVYEVLARGGDHHTGILFDWRGFTAAGPAA
jgi:2-desacetyl-2-hydroxyethyl bacteriochlorophyllide A dehydrogenase